MGSTVGRPVGFPHFRRARTARRAGERVAGIAAIAVCAFVALTATGAAGLDTGAFGLPAVALAVGALVLSVVLVRRGRPTLALLVALVSVPAVLATVLAGGAVAEGYACSDGERQALGEIPHVGGVRPGIAGELQGSGCIVRYTTTERADAIVTHYGESLSAAGWLLTGIRPGRDQASGDLYAERGRLSLWLSWFPAGGASTRVIVSLHD